jgi:3-dehydroquinate synthetase
LPTHVSEIKFALPPPEALLKLMYQDKKAEGGKLTFILAKDIGQTFIAKGVDEAKVLAFLKTDIAKQGLAKP